MPQTRQSRREPRQVLEERVTRQAFVRDKLRRDGGYPCEIQAAERMLRSFQAQLRATQPAAAE